MNTKTYLILHSALMAVMTATAVTMLLTGGRASTETEITHAETIEAETATSELKALYAVKSESAAPVTEAIETAAPVVKTKPLGEFLLTAYCGENYPHICNDGDATNTATGTTPTAGRTIAVDPKIIPYGTEVIIDGHVYIAEDCGGAIKGNRIDVFFPTHAEALQFGVQHAEVSIIQ